MTLPVLFQEYCEVHNTWYMYLQDNLNHLLLESKLLTGNLVENLSYFALNSLSISSPAAFRIAFDTDPSLRLITGVHRRINNYICLKGKKMNRVQVLYYFS